MASNRVSPTRIVRQASSDLSLMADALKIHCVHAALAHAFARMIPLPVFDSCDNCGACCRHMIVPPFVMSGGRNEALEKSVPSELIDEFWPVWQVRLEVPESPCLWYDATTARCRHYEFRPDACRAFEINSGPCRESRAKWQIDAT